MHRLQQHLIAATVILSFGVPALHAQSRALDDYVALGLRQNLGLRQ
jgi:hypothetical protein